MVAQRLSAPLGTHGLDGGGRRPDKRDPMVGALLRELGVLAQESVPRMDGLGTHFFCSSHELIRTEITLERRGGSCQETSTTTLAQPYGDEMTHTNVASIICHANMLRMAIFIAEYSDCLDVKFAARLNHSAGDLSSVGNQHTREEPGFLSCHVETSALV